jgi:hypothetical protein
MKPEIYKLDDGSEGWAVERCEPENDGVCHKAVFYGPAAARQASDFLFREYSASETPARRSA